MITIPQNVAEVIEAFFYITYFIFGVKGWFNFLDSRVPKLPRFANNLGMFIAPLPFVLLIASINSFPNYTFSVVSISILLFSTEWFFIHRSLLSERSVHKPKKPIR